MELPVLPHGDTVAACPLQVTGVCCPWTTSRRPSVLPDREPAPQPGFGLTPRRLGERRGTKRVRAIWIAWSHHHFNVPTCSLMSERKIPLCRIRGCLFGIGTAKTGSKVPLVIS